MRRSWQLPTWSMADPAADNDVPVSTKSARSIDLESWHAVRCRRFVRRVDLAAGRHRVARQHRPSPRGHFVPKTSSIALPILVDGQARGCIAVVWLTQSMPASRAIKEFLPPLRNAAAAVAKQVAGHQWSMPGSARAPRTAKVMNEACPVASHSGQGCSPAFLRSRHTSSGKGSSATRR